MAVTKIAERQFGTISTGLTNTSGTITANLSVGVSGGQSVIGGSASGNSLTLSSTSHATKGKVLFGTSGYDEVNNRLGIGTASPSYTLDVRGAGWFTGDLQADAAGSSTTTPRVLGVGNFASGRAARWQFGDSGTCIQNGYDKRMAIVGYWGIEIYGNRQYFGGVDVPFNNGAASDAHLNVIGTQAAYPIIVATAATSQTGNIQEWRNSSGTVLSAVLSSGNIRVPSIIGSSSASGTLTLQSTSNATKGKVLFGTSAYDEVNNRLGIGTASPSYTIDVNGTSRFQDNITVSDAKNIILDTTTGTKIGTGTTQKLGFWNAAPIAQPTTGVAASTLVSNGGTTLTATDTFDGYTVQQIVKALRNAGLLA